MLKKRNLNETPLNPKPKLTELGIFINLCVNRCNFKCISKKPFSSKRDLFRTSKCFV